MSMDTASPASTASKRSRASQNQGGAGGVRTGSKRARKPPACPGFVEPPAAAMHSEESAVMHTPRPHHAACDASGTSTGSVPNVHESLQLGAGGSVNSAESLRCDVDGSIRWDDLDPPRKYASATVWAPGLAAQCRAPKGSKRDFRIEQPDNCTATETLALSKVACKEALDDPERVRNLVAIRRIDDDSHPVRRAARRIRDECPQFEAVARRDMDQHTIIGEYGGDAKRETGGSTQCDANFQYSDNTHDGDGMFRTTDGHIVGIDAAIRRNELAYVNDYRIDITCKECLQGQTNICQNHFHKHQEKLHNCDTLQIWTADRRPRMMFYTRHAVKRGEPLCIDYGEHFWQDYNVQADKIVAALKPLESEMRSVKERNSTVHAALARQNAVLEAELVNLRSQVRRQQQQIKALEQKAIEREQGQAGRERRTGSGLVGIQVSKLFPQTLGAPPFLHHGSVESFDIAASRQYKVRFEDMDVEHWDRAEVVQRLRQPEPFAATAVTSRLLENEQAAGENCLEAVEVEVEQEELQQEQQQQQEEQQEEQQQEKDQEPPALGSEGQEGQGETGRGEEVEHGHSHQDEIDEDGPYAIGFELVEPFVKHICKAGDTIASVVETSFGAHEHEQNLILEINRRRLYDARLLSIHSRLLDRAPLLIPDAEARLRTRVSSHEGFFNSDGRLSWDELCEIPPPSVLRQRGRFLPVDLLSNCLFASCCQFHPFCLNPSSAGVVTAGTATDEDGQVHKIDAPALYRGMGYRVGASEPYIGRELLRGELEAKVVAYMPAADGEVALWMVVHTDGDREDLEEHELLQVGAQLCWARVRRSSVLVQSPASLWQGQLDIHVRCSLIKLSRHVHCSRSVP